MVGKGILYITTEDFLKLKAYSKLIKLRDMPNIKHLSVGIFYEHVCCGLTCIVEHWEMETDLKGQYLLKEVRKRF